VGKTTLSIDVARQLDCSILSADSRQFYREMNIGTAKPSQADLHAVTHYFIDHLSVHDPYSVGDYERDVIEKLDKIYNTQHIAILTGGTGFFIRAVLEGLDHFPNVPDSAREKLNRELEEYGITHLQEELESKDVEYYKSIDINNPHRLIRALSIIRQTGQTFSSFTRKEPVRRNFKPIQIALQLPRKELYKRINLRVDHMIGNGLLEEVERLIPQRELNALNTVGYSELFKYFDGYWSLDFAIDKIKQHTRNYAKRQITWFRNQGDWHFYHPEDMESIMGFINTSIEEPAKRI